jgi:hypothetical protein
MSDRRGCVGDGVSYRSGHVGRGVGYGFECGGDLRFG